MGDANGDAHVITATSAPGADVPAPDTNTVPPPEARPQATAVTATAVTEPSSGQGMISLSSSYSTYIVKIYLFYTKNRLGF